MKLGELAKLTFSIIEQGEENLEITGAAGLNIAKGGEITFLANPKYTSQVNETKASAIFVGEKEKIDRKDIAILRTSDPYLAYARALRIFHPEPKHTPSIHPSSVIDETAKIAPTAQIMANVFIGKNCEIGENVRIFPNVTIYDNVKIGDNTTIHSGVSIREGCQIGSNCIIQNNATIGSDGFGYARDEQKRWLKIPQVGIVIIEDDVEIGANTTIDRASVGETRIKRGVKIDNLVQIGHSCTVDEDSLICAQTGVAGSSYIGKRVTLAGQVGIAGHLKVGDDAIITAKSATSHDVKPGEIISGIPAFDNKQWLRSVSVFKRLGDMFGKLKELERKISKLEECLKSAK